MTISSGVAAPNHHHPGNYHAVDNPVGNGVGKPALSVDNLGSSTEPHQCDLHPVGEWGQPKDNFTRSDLHRWGVVHNPQRLLPSPTR